MVVPAGLADSQVLMLVDKDSNGRVSVKEILPVRAADDQWRPLYLEAAQKALSSGAGFVSSTQMEQNEKEEVLRIRRPQVG
jgi:hypothetical protein